MAGNDDGDSGEDAQRSGEASGNPERSDEDDTDVDEPAAGSSSKQNQAAVPKGAKSKRGARDDSGEASGGDAGSDASDVANPVERPSLAGENGVDVEGVQPVIPLPPQACHVCGSNVPAQTAWKVDLPQRAQSALTSRQVCRPCIEKLVSDQVSLIQWVKSGYITPYIYERIRKALPEEIFESLASPPQLLQ